MEFLDQPDCEPQMKLLQEDVFTHQPVEPYDYSNLKNKSESYSLCVMKNEIKHQKQAADLHLRAEDLGGGILVKTHNQWLDMTVLSRSVTGTGTAESEILS